MPSSTGRRGRKPPPVRARLRPWPLHLARAAARRHHRPDADADARRAGFEHRRVHRHGEEPPRAGRPGGPAPAGPHRPGAVLARGSARGCARSTASPAPSCRRGSPLRHLGPPFRHVERGRPRPDRRRGGAVARRAPDLGGDAGLQSGPKVLEEALRSVRGQLYPHWELCIADDASTDPAVPRLLARAAARIPASGSSDGPRTANRGGHQHGARAGAGRLRRLHGPRRRACRPTRSLRGGQGDPARAGPRPDLQRRGQDRRRGRRFEPHFKATGTPSSSTARTTSTT